MGKTKKDKVKFHDSQMAEARRQFRDKWFDDKSRYRRRQKHRYENFGDTDFELLEEELFPEESEDV